MSEQKTATLHYPLFGAQRCPQQTVSAPPDLCPRLLSALTAVLADAFADDPIYRCMFPDAALRRAATLRFMECIIRCSLAWGTVSIDTGGRGLACWLPQGLLAGARGPAVPAVCALLGAAFQIPLGSLGRAVSIYRCLQRAHTQAVQAPHWYLWALGVAPGEQRHGIGSRLMHPLLGQAEIEKRPCYLETANIAAVTFYKTLGFAVVKRYTHPRYGLAVWGMLR